MGGREQEREGLGHRPLGVCLCCGLASNPLLSADGGEEGDVERAETRRGTEAVADRKVSRAAGMGKKIEVEEWTDIFVDKCESEVMLC